MRRTTGVHRRLLLQVLHGASDANIRFSDLTLLLKDLGFQERVRGSHHIFTREGIDEILNLQPRGSMASRIRCGKFATWLSVINWRKDSNEQI